jgi:hypothetical protein
MDYKKKYENQDANTVRDRIIRGIEEAFDDLSSPMRVAETDEVRKRKLAKEFSRWRRSLEATVGKIADDMDSCSREEVIDKMGALSASTRSTAKIAMGTTPRDFIQATYDYYSEWLVGKDEDDDPIPTVLSYLLTSSGEVLASMCVPDCSAWHGDREETMRSIMVAGTRAFAACSAVAGEPGLAVGGSLVSLGYIAGAGQEVLQMECASFDGTVLAGTCEVHRDDDGTCSYVGELKFSERGRDHARAQAKRRLKDSAEYEALEQAGVLMPTASSASLFAASCVSRTPSNVGPMLTVGGAEAAIQESFGGWDEGKLMPNDKWARDCVNKMTGKTDVEPAHLEEDEEVDSEGGGDERPE